MNDDGNWLPTAWLTTPPFTFPLSNPHQTPTDPPASTPAFTRTPLEISPPTVTKTDGPTRTGVPLSTFRTPTHGGPTSLPLSIWSPITIPSFPLSSPRSTHNSLATTPKFTRTRYTHSSRTSSTSFGSSLTTSGSSSHTSSLSLTSSHSPSTTSSHSSSTTSSMTPSSRFPPPVTQTTFPSFSSSSDTSPQTRTSSSRTGMIVAAATGAIAFVIIAALLAVLCRKRYLKRVRGRAASDPFQDLDGEMVAVNQPLIIGGEPGSGAVAYSDPFTDDSRQVSQSGSLTGLGSVARRSSNESHEAVVDHSPTPTPDPRGGFATAQHDRPRPTNQLSPPFQPPRPGIAQSRSPQSLPQVQTQFQPQMAVPHPSSPPFDPAAIAYLRYADQMQDRTIPSPEHRSPGNPEGHHLTSAFSVASEPSPRYSTHVPPFNTDEAWGSIPDPIRALSSYRPSFDRRRSFTPSVSGPAYEPGDTVVIGPYNNPPRGPNQGFTSPGSEDVWNPYNIRDRDFGSRPSTIQEVSETATHSQEASNDSGGTSMSSHVVLTAERVQFTPVALSALSLALPSYTTSPALSSSSNYDSDLPPVPPLPPVQPLNLGKNKSPQG